MASQDFTKVYDISPNKQKIPGKIIYFCSVVMYFVDFYFLY
jgi:hypothetical protein